MVHPGVKRTRKKRVRMFEVVSISPQKEPFKWEPVSKAELEPSTNHIWKNGRLNNPFCVSEWKSGYKLGANSSSRVIFERRKKFLSMSLCWALEFQAQNLFSSCQLSCAAIRTLSPCESTHMFENQRVLRVESIKFASLIWLGFRAPRKGEEGFK